MIGARRPGAGTREWPTGDPGWFHVLSGAEPRLYPPSAHHDDRVLSRTSQMSLCRAVVPPCLLS